MGNCMETCIHRPQEQGKQQQELEETEEDQNLEGFQKETGKKRIKMVLTKVELEWLMSQLKEKQGKRLEDVLEEIERNRGVVRGVGWRPSLESISEIPEVQEMDR